MGRKRFENKTRIFDERTISRKQNVFNKGMRPDLEPSDLPYDSVSYLVNANGGKDSIRGRTGSTLWSDTLLPAYLVGTTSDDYYLRYDNGIMCSWSASGVYTDIPVFTLDMIGSIINSTDTLSGEVYPYIITEFIDANCVRVDTSVKKEVNIDELYEYRIVGKINAYFFDTVNKIEYYLVGNEIYALIVDGESWIQFDVISGTIANTQSQFFKIQENIVLNNSGGMFALNDITKQKYAWNMNGEQPQYPLGNGGSSLYKKEYSDPSTYNYVYTYSRLDGNILENRNSADTFIQLETAPFFYEDTLKEDTSTNPDFKPMPDQLDYFNVEAPLPIESVNYESYETTPGYKDYTSWVDLSEDLNDPYLFCVFNGENFSVYFDFGGVGSLRDVASALERGLFDISSEFRVRYNAKEESFNIYNRDGENEFEFTTDVSSGFNLITDGALYNSLVDKSMGIPLEYFRYPEERNDITHYSLYRTKDFSGKTKPELNLVDPTLVNNPNIFGWVEDVPVCGGFEATLDGTAGELTITSSHTTDTGLIGTTVISESFAGVQIVGIIDDKTYDANGSGIIANKKYCYGANAIDIFTAEKVSDTLVYSNQDFTEDDVGKQIFWYDGTTSIIKSVEGIVVKTIDSDPKVSQGALINPTSRKYYDTTNDVVQNGFLRSWPLTTRYNTRMPNTNIASYSSGILMSAAAGSNVLNYTDTTNFRNIGYHNAANQINNKIEKDIRCILTVNNLIAIFTANQTYNINPKQGQVISNEFGEFYTLLPDPFLVNGNVGTTHQFKWCYGDLGDVLMVTGEPAVRFFSGTQYERNRAKDTIQKTILQLMNPTMVMTYSTSNGVLIWGSKP